VEPCKQNDGKKCKINQCFSCKQRILTELYFHQALFTLLDSLNSFDATHLQWYQVFSLHHMTLKPFSLALLLLLGTPNHFLIQPSLDLCIVKGSKESYFITFPPLFVELRSLQKTKKPDVMFLQSLIIHLLLCRSGRVRSNDQGHHLL
jgi:hypothetical protein